MNLQGNKIILRAIISQDAPLLLNLMNDPEIEATLGGSSFPISEEHQIRWIENFSNTKDCLRCIISPANQPEKGVGTIILNPIDYKNGTAEIHIKLDRSAGQGRGYGTDAIQTIVKYAFLELRLNCIYAYILPYNVPSQKVFQKCGFQKDGILRSRVFKNGLYHDLFSYSIVKKDPAYEGNRK